MGLIMEIEYQLPADFECPSAVFSWIWRTPQQCVAKIVHDSGTVNDFLKFCLEDPNNFSPDYWRACEREWQEEIFINCVDAEVVSLASNTLPSSSPIPLWAG